MVVTVMILPLLGVASFQTPTSISRYHCFQQSQNTNGSYDHLLFQRNSLLRLRAVTEDESNSDSSSSRSSQDTEKNVEHHHHPSRWQLSQQWYNVASIVTGTTAVGILALPDRTMSTLLATQWGGAAGFALASALFQILKTAHAHRRLQSETYKRIHFGIFVFGIVGMLAIPGEAGFGNTIPYAMAGSVWLTLVRAYCAIVAWLGLKEGIQDNHTTTTTIRVVSEIVQLTKQSWHGFRVKNAKKALAYRNLMGLVAMGIFSNFMEGIFNIRYHGEFSRTWFEISLRWSAISRLFLIWTMIYTLKDAAERDRLTGTTFIQMNALVGLWAVLVGLGQSVYPLGIAFYRGVEMFAFSLLFFVKAYKSQKEKSQKKLSV